MPKKQRWAMWGVTPVELVVIKGKVQDHPEVRISLSSQESVSWTCNYNSFRITFPRSPFDRANFGGQKGTWVNSGPPRKTGHFKAKLFVTGATPIDPHYIVDP